MIACVSRGKDVEAKRPHGILVTPDADFACSDACAEKFKKDRDPGTFVTIRGISNYIQCDLLVKIVHYNPVLLLNTQFINIFKDLYTFIHYT
jgi:hypothetical protein